MFAAWLLALPPTVEQLVHAGRIGDLDVSPDGQTCVFAWDRLGDDDLYTVPLAGGEPKLLVAEPGDERTPRWSPDGKWIAYVERGRDGTNIASLVPPSGGASRVLGAVEGLLGWRGGRLLARTPGDELVWFAIDGGVVETVGAARGLGMRRAGLAPDGTITVFAVKRGREILYRIAPGQRHAREAREPIYDMIQQSFTLDRDGTSSGTLRDSPTWESSFALRRNGETRTLWRGGVYDYRAAANAPYVAVTSETPVSPASLYAARWETLDATLLVRGAPSVDALALEPPESITLPRDDGRPPLRAWLYRPRPERAHRGIVLLGDGGAATARYDATAHWLRINGDAVVVPAYGERTPGRDPSTTAVADIALAARWLVHEAFAAPGRVGVVGEGPADGALALIAAARHPGLLRAAVSVSGACDFDEASRDDDTSAELARVFGPPGRAWRDLSPSSSVDRLGAVGLFYGARDPQAASARKLAAALQAQGAAVWSSIFEDDGAPIARRRNRTEVLRRMEVFLDERL